MLTCPLFRTYKGSSARELVPARLELVQMFIRLTNTITRFKNEAKAIELAAINEASDVGSTYTVEASGDFFVIAIRDEDGFKVGVL